MSRVSENDGILGHSEYESYKNHSINVKFFGQVLASIGGATFFGLLMATANSLLQVAALLSNPVALAAVPAGTITSYSGALAATLFSGPALGFIVVGAACVYMAQRFFYESTILDQDFQAKKIAAATSKSQAIGIAQSPAEPTKAQTTPPGLATNAHEQREHAESHEAKWAEKVGGQRSHTEKHADAHEKKPHDAKIPKPHVDSWAEEVKHADTHAETARTLH